MVQTLVQTDAWNPAQYEKFRTERQQPFWDLLALIKPQPGMRVIDLGCGTGELTALLAERLPGAQVEGVDSSLAMLQEAAPRTTDRVSFRLADVATLADLSAYDLVFSNAVLQWVPDNAGVLGRILGSLRPGAQLAIQVPKNERHASHRVAQELARELPFADLLHGYVRESWALPLEEYSTLFYQLGCREQSCSEKVYGHVLDSTQQVVEWVKGTSLSAYLSRLAAPDRLAFEAEYRRRLIAQVGDHAPYFYPFRRSLCWGKKGD